LGKVSHLILADRELLGAALVVYLFVVFIAPKGAGRWGRKGYFVSVVIVSVLFGIWLVGTIRALLAFFAAEGLIWPYVDRGGW